jgi:hypothetical protein
MKNQILILLIAFFSISSLAQTEAKRVKEFNLEKKVAVQGYDVVAYFKLSKAVKGKKELALSYKGVIYYFSTKANKDAFNHCCPIKKEAKFMASYKNRIFVLQNKIYDEQKYIFFDKVCFRTADFFYR